MACFSKTPFINYSPLLTILVALGISLGPSLANSDDKVDVLPNSTIKNLHMEPDPFFEVPPVASGKYRGLPLNTEIKRSLVELEGTNFGIHYGSKPGYRLVANFYHMGKFYIARIPIDGASKTYVQLERVNKYTEHTMLRFQMKPEKPVELIAVIPEFEMFQAGNYGTLLEEPLLLDDAILTIEGVSPKGFPSFDMLRNGFNRAGLAFRFVSGAMVVHEGIIALNHRIKQALLNRTEAESSSTLMEAIDTSISRAMSSMYNVCTSNCTNEAFEILERGDPYVDPTLPKWKQLSGFFKEFLSHIWIFDKTISNFAKWGLTWRGFWLSDQKFIDLKEDSLWSEWVVRGRAQLIQRHYRIKDCSEEIFLDAP